MLPVSAGFTGTRGSNFCALSIRTATLSVQHHFYDSQHYLNGKKKKKKGRGLGSASKFNWNSNWLTKAGNHVPYENESIWCMRVCACLFSLPAEARGASMGNMCPGCQKEALLSCKINRRWGLPMLITAMFYFSLTQKVQEAQV